MALRVLPASSRPVIVKVCAPGRVFFLILKLKLALLLVVVIEVADNFLKNVNALALSIETVIAPAKPPLRLMPILSVPD